MPGACRHHSGFEPPPLIVKEKATIGGRSPWIVRKTALMRHMSHMAIKRPIRRSAPSPKTGGSSAILPLLFGIASTWSQTSNLKK